MEFTLSDAHLDRLDDVSAIDLGFPHDFLASDFVREIVLSGTRTETRVP